jgi:hypothetical protein
MSKNIIQDIKVKNKTNVKPDRFSIIRDELKNEEKENNKKITRHIISSNDFEDSGLINKNVDKNIVFQKKNRNKFRKFIKVISFLIIFLGVIFLLSTIFSFTKVNILSKTQDIILDKEEFKASKETNSPLHFEIMIFSDETEKDVLFTESKETSTFAKGEISIFNEFSTTAQKLAIHTRISDNDNLIYLTDKAVTIPGYKTVKGKIIPGSVSVGITAQNAGEKYNGDPRDFTIVGFKGTTKYTKIYARSKTPLSGGANGLVYSLGPKQLGEINMEAKNTFRNFVIKKVETQIPVGYILYKDATTFSFNIENTENSLTAEGKVKIKGTLSAILLKKDDLPKIIINKILPNILDNELKEIEIPNLNSFSFSFINPTQEIIKEMKEVSFTLSGRDTLIWHPNIELLKSELLGIKKKNMQQIFDKYPGISSASTKFFPPWISTFSTNPLKIKIILQ